ncbi:MAG: RNA 2',3'-cyclic phosphodiesterase [Anaerolineae bacterium]|nr:RNA 2',3'-cyclic phosphodiesterase [Anaerolineae bacterium]MDW8098211.1 RNA 2',3'-cyclic phosphodiesterase [Anaerolineae bacterium]
MKPQRVARQTSQLSRTPEVLRTFIAIELDEAARAALGMVQDELKPRVPRGSVRWVDPAGIHLTLKFLGETPVTRLPEIEAALRMACAPFSTLDLIVEGRGCFPNFRRPNVIWVAVRDRGNALTRLQRAIEEHLAPLGWPPEGRPFRPHLTLGRVNRGLRPDERAAVGAAVEAFEVEQIAMIHVTGVSLMRSDLRPTGAVYTRLFEVALEGIAKSGE